MGIIGFEYENILPFVRMLNCNLLNRYCMALLLLLVSVSACARTPKCSIDAGLEEAPWVSPNRQEAHIDGDELCDTIFQVRRRTTDERGLLFCLSTQESPVLVGAGKRFGNGGSDFSWMRRWSVQSLTNTNKQGVLVQNEDEIGGLILWRKVTLEWEQSGD